MKLPGQYPQLWEKSVFRKWPKSLWNVVCIFSMFCSVHLVYCYGADFGLMDLLYLVVRVGAMFAWGIYRMKAGKADVKKIEDGRNEVIREAMEYANDKDA